MGESSFAHSVASSSSNAAPTSFHPRLPIASSQLFEMNDEDEAFTEDDSTGSGSTHEEEEDCKDEPQAPPKKKRRQNVACDACRSRRVRCDLLKLLVEAEQATTGIASTLSFEELEDINIDIGLFPEISCEACVAKDITCTRFRALNPRRPRRSGKRIDEAKLWAAALRNGQSIIEKGQLRVSWPASERGASSSINPVQYYPHPPPVSYDPTLVHQTSNNNLVQLVPNLAAAFAFDASAEGRVVGSHVAPNVSSAHPAWGFHDTSIARVSHISQHETISWAQYYDSLPIPPATASAPGSLSHVITHNLSLPNIRSTHPSSSFNLPGDPWGTIDSQMPSWSRADDLSGSLVCKSLGSEMSRELVHTFFSSFGTFPCVNPNEFLPLWRSAGERGDCMTEPGSEALCAVIEAWGARYSDSPIILGHGKQFGAPGEVRRPICDALIDRCRKLIDDQGLMRKPSLCGIQALYLYAQFIGTTDCENISIAVSVESRLLHSVICDSMEALELMRSLPTISGMVDRESALTYTNVARSGPARLSRIIIVTDAIWAVSNRACPKVPQQAVDVVNDAIDTMRRSTADSWTRSYWLFVQAYATFADISRAVATEVGVPTRQLANCDSIHFCAAAESLLSRLAKGFQTIRTAFSSLKRSTSEWSPTFWPIDALMNLRYCYTSVQLSLNQMIAEHAAFRWAKVSLPGLSSGEHLAAIRDATLVGRLLIRSLDLLLQCCRTHARTIQELVDDTDGSMLLKCSSAPARTLISIIDVLVQTPCCEQGYPSGTPGGFNWTWEEKSKEISWCIDGLTLMSWTWSDASNAIARIKRSLLTLQPPDHMIRGYNSHSLPPELILAFEENIKAEDEVVGVALGYPERSTLATILATQGQESIPINVKSQMRVSSQETSVEPDLKS